MERYVPVWQGEVWHGSAGQAWKGATMKWNEPIWDEMDVIFADDTPIPEGREQISEEDFDRIREDMEDES